jgi:putative SOS response-associated peptidase YedK
VSRLHRIDSSASAVAEFFGAELGACREPDDEIVEGRLGLVVIEAEGRRLLKRLTWGFPRSTVEMRARGLGPERLGLVADLTNPMWSGTAVETRYRCLIAISAFANPAGPRGGKTRTWFSVNGRSLVAWAGFCRNTSAFGPVHAGMTMPANDAVRPTNDRMPVLLEDGEWDRWLRGSVEDVIAFQFRAPIASSRMHVHPTSQLWRSAVRTPAAAQMAML